MFTAEHQQSAKQRLCSHARILNPRTHAAPSATCRSKHKEPQEHAAQYFTPLLSVEIRKIRRNSEVHVNMVTSLVLHKLLMYEIKKKRFNNISECQCSQSIISALLVILK